MSGKTDGMVYALFAMLFFSGLVTWKNRTTEVKEIKELIISTCNK